MARPFTMEFTLSAESELYGSFGQWTIHSLTDDILTKSLYPLTEEQLQTLCSGGELKFEKRDVIRVRLTGVKHHAC
jgi:hypothetical protein